MLSTLRFYDCVHLIVMCRHLWLCIGKLVNDSYSLGDLGVVPNGTIQLQLQSSDPVSHPLQLVRPSQEYLMPDVITVRIHIGSFVMQRSSLQVLPVCLSRMGHSSLSASMV